jgi:hypothetical protein
MNIIAGFFYFLNFNTIGPTKKCCQRSIALPNCIFLCKITAICQDLMKYRNTSINYLLT